MLESQAEPRPQDGAGGGQLRERPGRDGRLEAEGRPGRQAVPAERPRGGLAQEAGLTLDPAHAGRVWMLAFQQGDERAFDLIVGHYQAPVLQFLRGTIRDAGRAEDLCQEVFLRVYRSRSRYQPTAAFRTWLFTIAGRLALNEIRSVRRRRRVFADLHGGPGEGLDGAGMLANAPELRGEPPSARIEAAEVGAILDELIAELPRNQRAAVELHKTGELSYKEISEMLGLSVMAVKSLLVRARENLKAGIERRLGMSLARREETRREDKP